MLLLWGILLHMLLLSVLVLSTHMLHVLLACAVATGAGAVEPDAACVVDVCCVLQGQLLCLQMLPVCIVGHS